MKLLLLIIFNLFLSSNILHAEIVENEVLRLKKWGMSYCISSFSHIEGLASEAAEAAEYYFIRGKFDDFLYYIRKYYNERVRENSHSHDKKYYSLLGCLNATESMDFIKYLTSIMNCDSKYDNLLQMTKPKYAVRAQMKKYAIAYCIQYHSHKKNVKKSIAYDRGAFFELGFHTDPIAYQTVDDFCKNLQCKKNIVSCCLDAMESDLFEDILENINRYSSIPKEDELREDQY